MAGKKRGMSIYLSLAEQVELPCLGVERCASAGRSVGNLGQSREEWRVSRQGTHSEWKDQGTWGREEHILASGMVERREPSQTTMRTKLRMDRKQDTSFTTPEWAEGNLFSGLTHSAFYFQQFWLFACCWFCLQTATVCLALVHGFAL